MDREVPVARWRWMGRRDAEGEGVVVAKKLIVMAEDLPSERAGKKSGSRYRDK